MLQHASVWFAHRFPLTQRAALLASRLPPSRWYWAARWLSRAQAWMLSARHSGKWTVAAAYLQDHWLIELTRLRAFPIPMRVCGAELLSPAEGDVGGIVMTGTHVPSTPLVLRAAMVSGHRPDLVVVEPENMFDGQAVYMPAGLDRGIPAHRPGSAAFLRARTLLKRRGGLLSCQVDCRAGGHLSPALLQLAGRVGARVVLYRTELGPDGTVEVAFRNAPYPFCRSQGEIDANLAHLVEEDRLLRA